jgi:hypothetical protein
MAFFKDFYKPSIVTLTVFQIYDFTYVY